MSKQIKLDSLINTESNTWSHLYIDHHSSPIFLVSCDSFTMEKSAASIPISSPENDQPAVYAPLITSDINHCKFP